MAETARRCIKEADEATGPLGADSSAAETTRYEYVERPNREERGFVETRQKAYWKYHITAILGLQIVLAAFTTPSNINDTTMLPVMLAEIRRRGFDFVGGFFDGDKGYDSDYNASCCLDGHDPQHQATEGCRQPWQVAQEEGGRHVQR